VIAADIAANPVLPSIPEPTGTNTVEVLKILKQIFTVRETEAGDPLDRTVTFRSLYKNGLLNRSAIDGKQYVRLPGLDVASMLPVSKSTGADFLPPPPPTGFTASGTLANVLLQWDAPQIHNYAYTEVWRAAVDDQGMAVRISTPDAPVDKDPLGLTGVTRYYWIRHVTKAGVAGPFNAIAGTAATTGFVDTPNIANLAVTNAKIGLLAVDTANIIDLAVATGKIANLAVTTAKIALRAVTTAIIDTAAVTTAKIANLAVTAAQIANATITAAQIANATITGALIVSGTITGTLIAANTVTATNMNVSQLSAISADMGAITAGTITLNTAGHIKGGQTAYNTGTGFFLGYSTSAYKFSIGNPSATYLTWDGSTLSIKGQFTGVDYVAGTKVIVRSTPAAVSSSASPVKVKEVALSRSGQLRVKFDLATNDAGNAASAQVFRNGSAVGSLQTTLSVSGITTSEDISGWSPGDLIQVFAWNAGGVGKTATVSNFTLGNNQYIAEVVLLD